jgi:DNA helicase-2/ATP-dependent DNA helicase PcrA
MVLSAVPMGNDTLLEIAFDQSGTKKLMANYARLQKK